MGIETRSCFPIGAIRAQDRFQGNKGLVQEAFDGGHFVDLTPKQRQVFTMLYLEGGIGEGERPLTFDRCAAELKVSRQAIGEVHSKGLRRLDRVKRGLPPVATFESLKLKPNLARARVLFDAGNTQSEIAKEVGCSISTLYRRAVANKDLGLISRKRGRPKKPREYDPTLLDFPYGVNKDGSPRKKMGRSKHVPGADPENLRALYWKEDLSIAKISHVLGGLSVSAIWGRMVSSGIKRRPPGRTSKKTV